jgi:hypothetical protein
MLTNMPRIEMALEAHREAKDADLRFYAACHGVKLKSAPEHVVDDPDAETPAQKKARLGARNSPEAYALWKMQIEQEARAKAH